MIGLKKFVSNELLQLALLLSIIRHRNDNLISNNNFEYESPTVGVGGRSNTDNEWNRTNVLVQHSAIHPKSLVNYQEDLIHELNALGRYNRIDFTSDVTAYLLNVDGTSVDDLPSIGDNSTTGDLLPSQPSQSSTLENETGESGDAVAKVEELSKEDMAIIEMLWKQDSERNINVYESPHQEERSSRDENRILTAGGATNSNDTDPEPSSSVTEQQFEDPNASESIVGSNFLNVKTASTDNVFASPCSSSSKASCVKIEDDFENDIFFPHDVDELFLKEKPYFNFDTGEFGLGFKNEFKEETQDSDFLLVADEPPHDLLSFPKDDYLINNALQLCELNDCCAQGASNDFSTTDSKFKEEKEKNQKTDSLFNPDFELDFVFEMMQTAQFHSARSYHHQNRVPYVRSALGIPGDQRWQDFASNFMTDQNASYPHHHAHPHPGHHLHHNYTSNVTSSYHMTSSYHPHHDSGAIIHNATLPPPIGDLNNTSPYHIGSSPNLGSAVSSSMNLTNCDSESAMAHAGAAAYKMDNDSIYYQHNTSNQSLTNQTESFFPSILNDEDLQLMDMAMNESMYGNMLDNVTSNASNNMTTPLIPPERCTDSDSAVSSMGSERVPSLSSDNEWMETNSDSGHTPGDHYSADYSKYRWYDNYMYSLRSSHSMSENSTGSHSRIPPVAQKKYHLYGKRLFHDHNSTAASTSSDLSSADSAVANIKYEMNDTESRLLEPSCSSKLYNSSSEMKYSCSSEFSRQPHRPSLSELVSHNHSYTLPQENLGATSRNFAKDKTAKYIEKLKMVDFAVRKSEEEQMTRDEKKARALNIPIPVYDIINLPMDEFNERLSKYDLSETQLSLIRDIRRRGKNKVAAQNCRKRKLDQIISLADEVKQMKDKKRHILQQHEYLSQESVRVKAQFSQLYKHVFNALRDSDGNPYSPFEFSLEQTTDGNVELVRRHHLAGGHQSTPSSSKDPSTSSSGSGSMDGGHSHHYSSRNKKDYHEHRKE